MFCTASSGLNRAGRGRIAGIWQSLLKCLLLLLFVGSAAQAQTTTLKITPITWDIIGLDSNNVNTGPNVFVVGARVCNIGSSTATNVTAQFLKTGTNNPYINLQDLDSYSVASLPAGVDPNPTGRKTYMYPNPTQTSIPANCFDFYFNGVITRTTDAYTTKQDYIIRATATNASTVQTPSGRALYIEKLVSQNRNSVKSLTGSTTVEVGKTYQYTLVVDTATGGYEQIEHFPNFPNNQFQILKIETSYDEPPNQKNQIAWGDACGWNYVYDYSKSNPNQSFCGPVSGYNITGGKAGGNPITTVYTVRILGPGNGAINNLIYDFSGSSYHYNSDYNTGGTMNFTSVFPPNLTVTKSTSTPVVARISGATASYSITVSNAATDSGTATSVVISDPLPTGFTYASTGTVVLSGGATRTTTSNPTSGSTTPSWGSFTLPAGASVTIPFTVNVSTSAALTTHQNGVTATYTSPDGTTGNQRTYNSASSTAEDVTLINPFDFGDAPTASPYNYGSASHLVGGGYLGLGVDTESANQPTTAANGDDLNGTDDEDGVTLNPALGSNYSTVALAGSSNVMSVVASASGFVNAWIDLNLDGDFLDAGEQVLTNQAVVAGSNSLNFTLGNAVRHGVSYLRVRYTTSAVGSPSPVGQLNSGEVEDHQINLAVPMPSGQCGVGLDNGGFESLSVPLSTYIITEKTNVPGWNTTATDNQIEIWKSGFNGVPAFAGGQFAELNANMVSSLYQDVVTVPGQVVRWTFAHRGRLGTDTLRLRVGAPTTSIASMTLLQTASDGTSGWGFYTGSYTVPAGQFVTRFAFESVSASGGDPTFGNFLDAVSFAAPCNFSGTIFEDYNYGGGAGRNFNSGQGMAGVPARVELYNANGNYMLSTTASSTGAYSFDFSLLGTHYIRVVNSTVQSSRSGYTSSLIPVQTYRSVYTSGSVTGVSNEVGGRAPASVDAASGASGAVLDTTAFTLSSGGQVQTVSPIDVIQTSVNVTGVNFGFNFDTIVNTNRTGQGSLAQFITNAITLGGETSLAQSGNRRTTAGTSESLPAGYESSIFMIPAAQHTSGVAIINLSGASDPALPSILGANAVRTIVDGTTQTANIGNTNSGVLGAGVTVGTGNDGQEGGGDDPTLAQVQRPEVQLTGRFGINGLWVGANNVSLRGLAVRGFGQNSTTSNHGDVVIDGASNVTIEGMILGTTASSFSDPGAGNRSSNGIVIWSGAVSNLTLQNNLIGFMERRGIAATGNTLQLDTVLIQQNEIRSTNRLGTTQGGGIELNPNYSPSGTYHRLITIRQNLITGVGTGDSGIELGYTPSDTVKRIEDNTISNNAFGGISLSLDTATGTATFNSSTVRDYILHNVITGNQTGVQIYAAGTISALNNKTISQNAIYDNTALGIDLRQDGVSANDGGLTTAQPNQMIDYPIITSSVLTGNSLQLRGVVGGNLPSNAIPTPNNSTFAGVTVEFFIADNNPANQNGPVLVSDTLSKPHGEGAIYIGQGTADASGNFNVTLTLTAAQVTALGTATNVTATATSAAGATSEFGPVYLFNQVSGTVFEDVNYGGGAGRDYATSNTSAQNGGSGFAAGAIGRANVTVEVYDSAGNPVDLNPGTAGVQNSVTTQAGGTYSIGLFEGNYQIRVVNSTLTSVRATSGTGLIPVQTYRTNASSGTAVAVTNRVGGENPAEVDAAANASSTLSALNAQTGIEVQSISLVNLNAGNVSGVDFGFNYDTIVSTRDSGQGSLRQFVLNANALGDESKLAQSGNRKKLDNTNEALPAGKESSIFMVPSGQLTTGVVVITLSSTVQFTGTNSPNAILDATTQTVNIGDTNSQAANGRTDQLGTGGTVGLGPDAVASSGDELVLNKVFRPEVEIKAGSGVPGVGLRLSANNITVRGVSIYGFGSSANSDNNANIQIDDTFVNTLIEQNWIGLQAARTAFDCSATAATAVSTGTGDNIRSVGGDNGTVRYNLIGCSAGKGFGVENSSTGWQIIGNEIRGNAILNRHLDGIDIENGASGSATVRGNLITANWGVGVDSYSGAGSNTIEQNTIDGNGIGISGGSPLEDAGIRLYGSGSTVQFNVIRNNVGSGVQIQVGSNNNVITRNSIHNNTKIGIDLLKTGDDETKGTDPYYTINDSGDTDTGGNDLLNFPVFTTATLQAGNLVVQGYARPGAAIELFIASPDPSGFGEGQTYLVTLTEGCASVATCLYLDQDSTTGSYGPGAVNGTPQGQDSTNRFQFSIPVGSLLASVSVGTQLTATATLGGKTSEFSGLVTISVGGFTVSGNVYEDLQPNGTREATESWATGTTVYVHLIQGGNVVATTTVNAGTGAFSFSNIGNGTYTLAVSSVSGVVSSPAPAIQAPTGWLYMNPDSGSKQVDVAGNVSNQNFGLYHGSRLTGRVFYDNAHGAASAADESKANNGIQDLQEKGASGVTVKATAGTGTVTAVTDGSGNFQIYLPHQQFGGQLVIVSHNVQPATGNNINNSTSVVLASALNDGLASSRVYSNTSGQVYGSFYFGVLSPSAWRPDQSGTTSSPGIIDYTHSYIPQTLGALNFATTGNLFYAVYGDLNCDGTLTDAEKNVNVLVNPVQVGYSWPRLSDGSFKPCEYHVLVSVPSNLAANSVDKVRVKAELTWQNNTSVKDPLYLLDTTTTRTLGNGGKLSLTKGLRNITQGETSYTTSNGGKVGETIEYKITFTNSGDTVITDIVLGDNIPYFTDLLQNMYGATGEMELHCPNGAVVNVHLGVVGVIDLPLNLPTSCNITQMAPGDFGYFLYQVKIR
ncbi:beta strand repeat-containing protein [Deinococcus cellulosilyticus]|uniref:DUF11 domain-containing protein n=1 Tax=Deinococcus cellulosilyticus (strain DSM 18568 / NBRC 106333 / KACC 11606 / 5516J-15) TaxID=1223518 RepID=A0A511MXE4_DEIC1|nr:SdrD B-like domain-containing protein [Deinococcus cellulosilyticus]GEM45240.1 hypothetical protein DC3_08750 [Deinococcus cellulosilyticus NBRC 106333 = KACC 11606]